MFPFPLHIIRTLQVYMVNEKTAFIWTTQKKIVNAAETDLQTQLWPKILFGKHFFCLKIFWWQLMPTSPITDWVVFSILQDNIKKHWAYSSLWKIGNTRCASKTEILGNIGARIIKNEKGIFPFIGNLELKSKDIVSLTQNKALLKISFIWWYTSHSETDLKKKFPGILCMS